MLLLLCIGRINYWVPKGRRKIIRKIITKCKKVTYRYPSLKSFALETTDISNARNAISAFQSLVLDLIEPIALELCCKCIYGYGFNQYNLMKKQKSWILGSRGTGCHTKSVLIFANFVALMQQDTSMQTHARQNYYFFSRMKKGCKIDVEISKIVVVYGQIWSIMSF